MFLLPLGLLVRWVQIATATLLAVYLASLHSFFPAFSDTIPIHIGHRSNASENCPISLRNHCPISIGIGVRYGLEQVSELIGMRKERLSTPCSRESCTSASPASSPV